MNARDTLYDRIFLILLIMLFAASLFYFTYHEWLAEPADMRSLANTIENTLLLSLPLLLLYGGLYVLVHTWWVRRQTGQVSPRQEKIIRWTPRIAGLLVALFVGMFSLDVFDMDGTLLEKLGAFVIHSLPSIGMAVLLFFAWRRPVVGFVVFLLSGLFFMRFVVFNGDPAHFLLFSGPMLVVAALFFADWKWMRGKTAVS